MIVGPATDARIEAILELILRLGNRELGARGELTDARDELDGIVSGLNMLADELEGERAERMRVEALLRDEVAAYEDAPGLFCLLDAGDLRVIKCNTTLAQTLGRPKSAIVGTSVLELHTEACRVVAATAFATLLGGEPPANAAFDLLRGDGEPVHVQLAAAVTRDPSGRPERVRVVWRDVTEQKRLEGQLMQSQKLQGIGQLAGAVAHDFNNLLTVILATAIVAKDEAMPGSPLAEDLAQIQAAADSGAELTRGLLAFSRRTVVKPRPTSLTEVVERAARLLGRLLGEGIRLDLRVEPDAWPVLVDPGPFEQVVMNLALNARDAMPGGGTLTIETANVTLDRAYAAAHLDVVPGDYVMLAVSDTGVGMTDEIRERAFEPFFTTKTQGKGTGLGLAICYGIVQQAQGSLWLYSEVGRGTTVKVYVPRMADGDGDVEAAEEGESALSGSETLLVAEDDARVRGLTVRILRRAGYRVLEATNGKHALDVAAGHPGTIDLVVTDVMMPEMGGRQLVDELKRRGLVTRALFVSGYTENSIVHQGVLEEGIEFLAKPFGPGMLLERVAGMLAAGR
jgi:two-component system cell cycle sensor histidine kinase/response regulator CckA